MEVGDDNSYLLLVLLIKISLDPHDLRGSGYNPHVTEGKERSAGETSQL